MPQRLAFCIDGGPAPWASAQRKGDPAAIKRAVDKTIQTAVVADRAGIDSLWLLEDPDGWDAFAVLGAMARQTDRIRLGTGVVNTYYRTPAQIASSISTLDFLSNGRAFLGLGRGQVEWYENAMGMLPGNPNRRTPEAIDLLRLWWSEEMMAASDPDDTEFAIREWERVIRPLQSHVPIYFAAVGPIAMRIAAEHADGVIFNDLTSFSFMETQIRNVKEMAAAAGRDPEALTFNARCQVTITDDPEALYERRKSTVATIHSLPGMERLLQNDTYDIGAIMSQVREAMHVDDVLARGGAFAEMRRVGDLETAKAAIPTDLMAELVVTGDVPTIRQRLEKLAEIGVTHVFLAVPENVEQLPAIVRQLQS
ncbi:MAG: LLM class flavin-dependent oxidoreductase [Thermomicrobiales bacterium]|nr:LLM class flavin-dependent oxidoreductase [Thermomicrobiales bacterium]